MILLTKKLFHVLDYIFLSDVQTYLASSDFNNNFKPFSMAKAEIALLKHYSEGQLLKLVQMPDLILAVTVYLILIIFWEVMDTVKSTISIIFMDTIS